MKTIYFYPFLLLILFTCLHSVAQNFTQVTTITNPIVSDPVQSFYAGASWIDYDTDGRLDLFVVRGGLYHNDGNGAFTKISTSGIGLTTGIGNTWADVDNDGDIDCMISGGNTGGSRFYMNNGNGSFTQNINGPFANPINIRGWGSAFGDYNNDGLADLFIAAAYNFANIKDSCKFFINSGGGNFIRVDSLSITDTLDAFTVPSWSDYDNDGDVDLFIGSGRVNGSLSRDYLFDNNHFPGTGPLFSRNNSMPLGTDLHDGQIWNWIDFDNDGDLDAFLTNYSGTTPTTGYQNEMYRNDNGTFVQLTVADVGPIVTDLGHSLSNTWGDFDNDGDIDCIVTNENMEGNVYYESQIMQGSSVFITPQNEPFEAFPGDHFCATSADYDNDGDLDLFISGNSDKGLYVNSSPAKDFINIKLIGMSSNKSGLGAKVRVKAHGFWQMREIAAQNTFNGMNMLNAHFGFGFTGPVALQADSILIEWPSGTIDLCTNVYVNSFYTAMEGQCLVPAGVPGIQNDSGSLLLEPVFPNPAMDLLTFNYYPATADPLKVSLTDESGNVILTKTVPFGSLGKNSASLDIKKLSGGLYTLNVVCGKKSGKAKFVKQ